TTWGLMGALAVSALRPLAARAESAGRARYGAAILAGSVAAAIAPALLIAVVRWPDGRGALTTSTLLVINLIAMVILAAVYAVRRRSASRNAATRERVPTSTSAPPPDRLDQWSAGLIGLAL